MRKQLLNVVAIEGGGGGDLLVQTPTTDSNTPLTGGKS